MKLECVPKQGQAIVTGHFAVVHRQEQSFTQGILLIFKEQRPQSLSNNGAVLQEFLGYLRISSVQFLSQAMTIDS